MTTSGTRRWTMTVDDIVQEAFEKIGGEPSTGKELDAAIRALNMLLTDLTNEKVNLFALQEALVTVSASQGTYTLPTSVVDVMDVALRRNSTDTPVKRIAFQDYLRIPRKTQTGRAIKYFVDRRVSGPVLYIWPLPTNSTDVLYHWRVRRIEDVTALGEDIGVPYRFMPLLAFGLAHYLSMNREVPPEKRAAIQNKYMELKEKALSEDRDRSSIFIRPWVRRI